MVFHDQLGINFGNFWTWLYYGAIGIGIVIIVVIIGVFIFFRIKYSYKIVLFRKINNAYLPVLRTRATKERVGMAGAYWFRTLKMRKTLPVPIHFMRRNEVWYIEREDGEWFDFNMPDVDAEMHKAGLKYTRQDVSMTKEAMAQYMEKRYTQESFWQKYGQQIILFFFILIVTGVLIYALSKFDVVATQFAEASKNILSRCQITESGLNPP